ncbi:pectin lyase-like family, partial [Trichomonas vaginalis G3]|uniref:pectin lyase-like family n=1 Tax=Trichomonas vaginalis (strain ATCC PRA-98 / G3) TaxID=412133 RepID=UPI0021E54456
MCVIKQANFEQNQAADGGAICFFRSNSYLEGDQSDYKFYLNKAFRSGGAIFCEGFTLPDQNINKYNLFIFDYAFTNNTAYQTGCAIAIESDSEIYFENLIFRYNQAGDQGGAIACYNSKLSVFKCAIQANIAGKGLIREDTLKLSAMEGNFALRFRGRGCGGISFISTEKSRQFISQENCFY